MNSMKNETCARRDFVASTLTALLGVLAALLVASCKESGTAPTAGAAAASGAASAGDSGAPSPGKETTGAVPSAGGYLDVIKARGKLLLGVKFDVPIFGLKNPMTNRVEGFDSDIGREMAKAMLGDVEKAEFVEAISSNRIPFLQEDKVDLVVSTMTISDARKKEIDFSDPYYIAGQSILVPKGSPIKGVADLNGKNICTAQGSTSEKNIREKAPNAKMTLFGGYSECYTALENGQVDGVSTDDIILFGLKLRAVDKFDLVGGQFTTESYGIGIKKGRPELVAFVNSVLTAMKTDGRWKALYDKHLKPVSGISVDPPQ